MITLTLRGDVWTARYDGPDGDMVRDAFGTDEVPTPYTAATDVALMVRAIAYRNPQHKVVVTAARGPFLDERLPGSG